MCMGRACRIVNVEGYSVEMEEAATLLKIQIVQELIGKQYPH